MASPFPGMDPYVEMQEWADFHAMYMTVLRELLNPQVRPRYVVRVERRVYLERPPDEPGHAIADVAGVERRGTARTSPRAAVLHQPAAAVGPVECLLPEAEELHEYYLMLRDRETSQVVTLIELLSPANKRAGSAGRERYLQKRDEVLRSRTSLVELDLLRSGRRLPMQDPLPAGDYYALVCRAWRRRRAAVYAWTLRDRLPAIPIPLRENEPEPALDLQAAFDLAYDRAAYQDSLDYTQPLNPPASPGDAGWLREIGASC